MKFILAIIILNLLTLIIISVNFHLGNETDAIFQAIRANGILNLIVFTELASRRR